MYRTVMVPLDGSPLAERALPFAEAVVSRGARRVVLLRAAQAHATPGTDTLEAQLHAVTAAEAYLKDMAGRLAVPVQVDTAVFYGDAAEAILEEMRLRTVELLVMATHGRSGLGRWLFGSVADQVLRRARAPVLLVPPACNRRWRAGRPLHIVVPLDGSDFALTGLGAARTLAKAAGPAGATISLLRVVEPVKASLYAEAVRDLAMEDELDPPAARRYLEGVGRILRTSAREITVHAATGDPAACIATFADRHGADVVVMATHGRSGVARLVLGSVTAGVLRRTATPLLLVRPSGLRQPTAEESAAATPRPAWEPRITAGALT